MKKSKVFSVLFLCTLCGIFLIVSSCELLSVFAVDHKEADFVWKGNFTGDEAEELAEPELYWAYFNTTDGNSYIYN